MLKVKLGTFLPINRFVHFDLISNIFSCRYESRILRMKLFDMMQSCKSGRTFQIGPGSGLSLSKYFGPACMQKFFIALGVRIFSFVT